MAVMFLMMMFVFVVMAMLIIMVVVMMVLVLLFPLHQDIELHRAQIRSRDARSFQFISFDRQLSQLAGQIPEIHAEVQQGADRHISADAGEAVEVQRLHSF